MNAEAQISVALMNWTFSAMAAQRWKRPLPYSLPARTRWRTALKARPKRSNSPPSLM